MGVDMNGTTDKPVARSTEAHQSLIDNNSGAVLLKKDIQSNVGQRIPRVKAVEAKVKADNSALPATPTVATRGDDRIIISAATRAKVAADNGELPISPSVETNGATTPSEQ